MCINNKDGVHEVASLLLRVGEKYTVVGQSSKGGYILEEIKFNPKSGKSLSFTKERFIPLSDIDETELIKERELVND